MENKTENNDSTILDSAIKGDHEAFGVLYQENIKRIYNYIYYRTGNSADAEDLTARVFQRALRHINSYKKTSVPFSAWLYRIAHNLVANWYRDNSRKKEIPIEDQEYILSLPEFPESTMIKNQEEEGLMRVMRMLAVDRQQLIILKFVEGLSNIEIARIMGRSEGAVKSLYHRTLLEMRELIQKN